MLTGWSARGCTTPASVRPWDDSDSSSGQLGQQAHEGLAFIPRERLENSVLDIDEHRVSRSNAWARRAERW